MLAGHSKEVACSAPSSLRSFSEAGDAARFEQLTAKEGEEPGQGQASGRQPEATSADAKSTSAELMDYLKATIPVPPQFRDMQQGSGDTGDTGKQMAPDDMSESGPPETEQVVVEALVVPLTPGTTTREDEPEMPGSFPREEEGLPVAVVPLPTEQAPSQQRATERAARPGFRERLPDLRFGLQARLRSGVLSQIIEPPASSRMQQVPVVDLKVGQPTWKAWGASIGTKGVTTSVRPREDINSTFAQLNFAFMSQQTAFQFKGSDLLGSAERILFAGDDSSALEVIPRSAKVVGNAAGGNGRVVELTYSLGVKATNAALPDGEVAFFGERASNKAGFARLNGDLTYTKLFKEFKGYPTAGIGPISKHLPVKLRWESRPEIPGRRTISNGEIVSRQFLDQNKAVLEQTHLKVQFTVDNDADLTDFLRKPTVEAIQGPLRDSIRAFDVEGQFDPGLVKSWVPGYMHGLNLGSGGLRLSAVNEKPSLTKVTELTGKETTQWDPKQTNLDIVFNDPLELHGMLGWLNPVYKIVQPVLGRVLVPDQLVSQAAYYANRAVPQVLKDGLGQISESIVPSWMQFGRLNSGMTSPSGYVPTYQSSFYKVADSLYDVVGGDKYGAKADRYTVSVQSPAIPIPYFELVNGTAELRLQWKTRDQDVAPAIRNNGGLVRRHYPDGAVQVPGWLSSLIDQSKTSRSHVLVPRGGHAALEAFLDRVGNDPNHQVTVNTFRENLLPLFDDSRPENTGFLSPQNLIDVDHFLGTLVVRRAAPLQRPGVGSMSTAPRTVAARDVASEGPEASERSRETLETV